MAKRAIQASGAGEPHAHRLDAARLRPAWVEIDLAAIRHNVKVANRLAGGAKLFAVCKGDGYGGGVVEIARAAVEAGAHGIAVGAPVDAVVLRQEGIRCPILLYAATLPEDAAAVVALGVIVTIHDFPSLNAFARLGAPVEAFVKIDCGLGRLGINPEDFAATFDRLKTSPNIRLEGIYAHFAVPEDPTAIGQQEEIFDSACRTAERAGFGKFERMVASSRVMLGFPNLNLTAINPGRFILGMIEPPWANKAPFKPAVRALKARIIQIKDQPASTLGYGGEERRKGPVRAAVLPIGYGEGLPHLPPCHEVLVHGKRAPILSRRGIEHTVIDVTGIPEVRIGDEAVLLGRQGKDEINADELSRALDVPVLELIPRLAFCAPRRYMDDER
jgi:alanine racemase